MPQMTTLRPRPLGSQIWVSADGHPTEQLATFIQSVETLLKMINGTGGITLIDAVDDAAAAAAGVNVGALYRNGSVVMIRVV